MDTGKSLRVMQAKLRVSNKDLAETMGISTVQVHKDRKSKTMNGYKVIAYSDYFGLQCWEFIKIGEEK